MSLIHKGNISNFVGARFLFLSRKNSPHTLNGYTLSMKRKKSLFCFFSRYVLENCPGDTIDKITTSEHDGGYSLNYEARQNASKLNQAVKTINAFEKRTESCQYHRSKGKFIQIL